MDLSYILNHLGEDRDQYFDAVTPPIIQSSNFTFKSVAHMREMLKSEMDYPLYTRGANPTVAILRKKLAALENAEDAWVFSSGSAAMTAAVMAQVESGDHIICIKNPYSWTKNLVEVLLAKFNVAFSFIDGTSVANFEAAIRPETKVILLESPNSITFEIQDLKAVASIARSKGITTIIDNSYCSPLYQKPLDMGIDIVMHTASKYLGGHSDMVAGCLMASKEHIHHIFKSEYMTLGATISPHDAWLMIRSLRTLPIRMERTLQSTSKVIDFIKDHPLVERLYYPFDEAFPQYELAKAQMDAAPGLFSILLRVDEVSQVEKFVDSLKLFILAVSWGGYESLVLPMCVTGDSENYQSEHKPFNLIRFSIGMDDADALIEDLKQAFGKIS